MSLADVEVKDIDTDVVRGLRRHIGEKVELTHTVTLSGVGSKGISVAIESPFGGTYEFPVYDILAVRPAPEAG